VSVAHDVSCKSLKVPSDSSLDGSRYNGEEECGLGEPVRRRGVSPSGGTSVSPQEEQLRGTSRSPYSPLGNKKAGVSPSEKQLAQDFSRRVLLQEVY